MNTLAGKLTNSGVLSGNILRQFALVSCFCFHILANSQDLPKGLYITIEAKETTIYGILNLVSEQTGYFFVYDNQIIDNNKVVKIKDTHSELFSFIKSLVPSKSIDFKVIGQHILVFDSQKVPEVNPESIPDDEKHDTDWFIVSGTVLDMITGERLPYASVGIANEGLGISTNLEGTFRFRVPINLINNLLSIHYLGYKTKQFPLELLKDNSIDVFLEPDMIELEEVVIRNYDPLLVVMKMLENKDKNFSDKPVYHYNFYREGVSRNGKLINYSEAIFKIFKESIYQGRRDQVKVLRARNTENAANTDTLVLKLKAGVQSTLELDIMKEVPDFLHDDYMVEYHYSNAGFSTRGGRSAYSIEFEQKKEIKKPLFKGILYIDTDDYALIEAEFEVNPKYIADAGSLFFIGWKKEFIPTMNKARYNISYQKNQGFYHVHHIRGELELNVGTRRGRGSNSYAAFFETVVVRIEENDVRRFSRREVIKPNIIFVDQGFKQDEGFWGEFNIITPEKSVIDAFSGIRAKIESYLEE